MRKRVTITRKKVRRSETQDNDDTSTDAPDGAVDTTDSAARMTAALAAFEHMVAEIEGAEISGQALLIDGRVLIDLAESSQQVTIDLVATDENNDRQRSNAS